MVDMAREDMPGLGVPTTFGEGTTVLEVDALRRIPVGRVGVILGDETRGGEGTLGGVGTFGGEYVRGEPSIAGDLSPVGEIKVGKGREDLGAPAICSACSPLKSRRTTDGRRFEDVDEVEGQSLLVPVLKLRETFTPDPESDRNRLRGAGS